MVLSLSETKRTFDGPCQWKVIGSVIDSVTLSCWLLTVTMTECVPGLCVFGMSLEKLPRLYINDGM